MTDTTPRILTGHTICMVKVADGEVAVRRGEPLPVGVTGAEVARLTAAGAFGPAPVADLAAQGAAQVPGTGAAAAAEAAARAAAAMTLATSAEVSVAGAEEAEHKVELLAAVQRDAEALAAREDDVSRSEAEAAAASAAPATKATGPTAKK